MYISLRSEAFIWNNPQYGEYLMKYKENNFWLCNVIYVV